jgi:hypothetical protein
MGRKGKPYMTRRIIEQMGAQLDKEALEAWTKEEDTKTANGIRDMRNLLRK